MWVLETTDPKLPLTFRMVPNSVKTIGRAPRADFVVDAPLVSRLHCQLSLNGDRLDVQDLGSTNGTWVNGRKIERIALESGDMLRVGRVEFQVLRSRSG